MTNRILLFLLFFFVSLVFFYTPIPIHHSTDFKILYLANSALLNGISLYDYQAQIEWLQVLPGTILLPYPYPPWYALLTLPLAFFPIELAARLWFLLNVCMIVLAVWLLMPSWQMPLRLVVVLFSLTFVPTLGLLIVGQYSAPILLGTSLYLWSVREKSAVWIAIAIVLMTFKPHLGLFLVLAALGWLVYHCKDSFVRRALFFTVILSFLIFVISFFADPAWPLTYFQSLVHYRDVPGVQSCGLCASLPVHIVDFLTGSPNLDKAVFVSVALAIGFSGLFLLLLRFQKNEQALFVALSVIFTLLIYPYLLNYDFILLLVPFVVLLNTVKSWFEYAIIFVAYLLPWGMVIYGRDANILLSVSAIILLISFWRYLWYSPKIKTYVDIYRSGHEKNTGLSRTMSSPKSLPKK